MRWGGAEGGVAGSTQPASNFGCSARPGGRARARREPTGSGRGHARQPEHARSRLRRVGGARAEEPPCPGSAGEEALSPLAPRQMPGKAIQPTHENALRLELPIVVEEGAVKVRRGHGHNNGMDGEDPLLLAGHDLGVGPVAGLVQSHQRRRGLGLKPGLGRGRLPAPPWRPCAPLDRPLAGRRLGRAGV